MPKPKFLSSDRTSNFGISVSYFELPFFLNPLHYHKELAYIIEGYGTRYVGSSIKSYQKGDMVLVGEELTHVWKSDQQFYEKDTDLLTKAIVLKFYPDFAGKDFLRIPDVYPINRVFEKASGGLHIEGKTNEIISNILHKMLDQSSLEQMASLIQILSLISKSEEVEVLSNFDLHKSSNPKEKDRMNKIIQHTMLNFTKNISLDEISNVANLSKSAFCRYFKNAVKKSYSEFLYEVRVEFACKMLLESNVTIMQICYESGFNNPSAFSQIFKRAKGVTPNQYRKSNMIVNY
ncbi:AraC family transcriptional regulator [Aquimarina algiphila]|uniref:Helix-turn-helix transcriptional regulator n=1 Tax=Aquimarina algiphila TaxID=2047982 RepID=A0A554VK29_9FLAO|nr:AraC family transcriptional regulator [Aquimarina algiphila]TSE08306.1 helix-turn-helix transcriptional regulator [Aquimarina algiphila]